MMMDQIKKETGKAVSKAPDNLFSYLYHNIKAINDSKIFAGLMIITLNISSKFVNVKISKTMESYLRNTFSRHVLVFAIAWMGTRDVFIAGLITLLFIFIFDFLLNEESALCVLPEHFTDYHLSLMDEHKPITKEDIDRAMDVLKNAQRIINDAKITDICSSETSETKPKPFLNQTPM
jgi:hypothetical protein